MTVNDVKIIDEHYQQNWDMMEACPSSEETQMVCRRYLNSAWEKLFLFENHGVIIVRRINKYNFLKEWKLFGAHKKDSATKRVPLVPQM